MSFFDQIKVESWEWNLKLLWSIENFFKQINELRYETRHETLLKSCHKEIVWSSWWTHKEVICEQ